MGDILTVAWQRYMANLRKHPLQTKSLTSASLAALSNVIAQRMLSSAPLNWRKALAMSAFGFCVGAPANHYWQNFMERLFKGWKRDGKLALLKALLDAVTFGQLYNLVALSYISFVVEGRSWSFTRRKVRQEFPSVALNGLKVWPVVHYVNYRYLPLQLRVPFISCSALFWSVFLILRAKGTMTIRPGR